MVSARQSPREAATSEGTDRERTSDMTEISTTYTTRDDAIYWEIIRPIEASGEVADAHVEFDIEAIADEVLGDYEDGFACMVDADRFWEITEAHLIER